MPEQESPYVEASQKPVVYSSTGPLLIGDNLTLTESGVLNSAGGGLAPGVTVNCGSFS